MQTYQIVFACFYFAALICYFFVETSNRFKLRVAIKVFMATCYLSLAVINTMLNSGNYLTFKIIVCVACFFAWFGDLFLLFKKRFVVGAVFFLISNITLIFSEITVILETSLSIGDIWWFVLIFALIYGLFITAQCTHFVDFGKKYAVAINCYMLCMTATGSIGIAMAFSGVNMVLILFGAGVALFMTSDYLLGFYMFRGKKNAWLVSNSASYFTGLFLLAMALAF